MAEHILEFRDVGKQFAGVRALDKVSFSVDAGEIHAIVGENGAGKSTLMKIVSGFYPAGTYEGSVFINGQEIQFKDIADAESAGVAIIYQELALVPKLNVIDNIFLGHELKTARGSIDMMAQSKRTQELLELLGLDVNPFLPVQELGVGQQQLIEIAKAINRNARIIIFDEPTAALNEKESYQLLDLIRDFKAKGITSIYVSHKLEEVLAVADRLTILRDGSTVETAPVKGNAAMNEGLIISYMVGRTIENRFPWAEKHPGDVVLEVRNWTVPHPVLEHKNALENINLSVRKGEIVGLGGLMGAGRTEFALSLIGLYQKPVTGTLAIDGREERINNPNDAIRRGLCYLTEDRKGKGLILFNSIKTNMTLASLKQFTHFSRINPMQEDAAAQGMVSGLSIKSSSLEQLAGNLSGGNQQKVVLAKWLLAQPKVLILDEPTRGIDVGAKYEIYELMNRLTADQGVGILMISSELPELLGVCDRIIVMHEGELAGELDRKNATPELFMKYATGVQ
ncbi:sugar ABC transporter ATP-binding protein [Breznakiella homolactica]|uniref:Sugar ABC transporter ATP-binding protein n=1 Tax=Breznakiella homolactica TaxID=2798577 RepID=A0A7T8BCS9_9SPIR|nr:sugar ABC transporter ATP-binding protein [Breznakiella homolactica]QQO10578.1 sugar ABC transporter ATP-binding protein [Breznakiella homolactica]